MKIAVVGLGAVGTVYACMLKKAKHEVWGADLPAEIAELEDLGFSVSGLWGRKRGMADELSSDIKAWAGEDFELVILAVKAPVVEEIAADVAAMLAPQGLVLLLQDGYGIYETAAQFIDPARLITAQQSAVMEQVEIGDSLVTEDGDGLHIGAMAGKCSAADLEQMAAVLNAAGIVTVVEADIRAYMWAGVIINASFATLCAVAEENYGKLLEDNETKVMVDNCIKEIFILLDKMGETTLWPDAASCQDDVYSRRVTVRSQRKPAMVKDLRQRRPGEMKWFNGAVCKLSLENGLFSPTNEMMRTMYTHKEEMGLNEQDDDMY